MTSIEKTSPMSKRYYDEPRQIWEGGDGDEYWVVHGHDRPAAERWKLMRDYGVHLDVSETWARVLPAKDGDCVAHWLTDGARYEGQRGAWPCTIYRRTDEDSLLSNLHHTRRHIAKYEPLDQHPAHQQEWIAKRLADLRQELRRAEQIKAIFDEMIATYDREGLMHDIVAGTLERLESERIKDGQL